METILTILICYLFGVALYIYIRKNSAINKYNPHVKYFSFLKEGLIGMAIGFVALGALLWIIQRIIFYFH